MTACRKIPALLALAGLASFAAPGFAAETIEIYTAPATTYYTSPADDTYYSPPATSYYAEPVPRVYYEPPITVTGTRMSDDELITSDVVDTLAADPWLSGKIGVETDDRRVELSGIVTTPGQARRAERDARSVPGVREVHNTLSTRVGGSRY